MTTMTQFPDVRRHPDGSLDLDFYRRRAARLRRAVARHHLTRFGQTMNAVISSIAFLTIRNLHGHRDQSRRGRVQEVLRVFQMSRLIRVADIGQSCPINE
jgi:hypothetical protein